MAQKPMLVYRLRPVPLDRDPQMREMIGLAKGFICDGVLNDVEANSLRQWLVCNSAVLDTLPASRLGERLLKAFEDGVVDDLERKELTSILLSVSKLA